MAHDDLKARDKDVEQAAFAQRSNQATHMAEVALLRTQLDALTTGLATTQGVVANLSNQEVRGRGGGHDNKEGALFAVTSLLIFHLPPPHHCRCQQSLQSRLHARQACWALQRSNGQQAPTARG
jgi:hypothetical protein